MKLSVMPNTFSVQYFRNSVSVQNKKRNEVYTPRTKCMATRTPGYPKRHTPEEDIHDNAKEHRFLRKKIRTHDYPHLFFFVKNIELILRMKSVLLR